MNKDIQCYKIWYMVNNEGRASVPEENRGSVTKTCREDCGCFLVKCRGDLRELLLAPSTIKIEEQEEVC